MFSFNKYDILVVHKTENPLIFNLEYQDKKLCQKYRKEINLEDSKYFDNTDTFVSYLTDLETKKDNPKFEYYINTETKIPYIQITFPFEIKYKKTSNFIIELQQILTCEEINIDMLNQKLKMLEEKIINEFVIPYSSDICKTTLTDTSPIEKILEEVNEKAVKFCKENYYLDNADHFELLNYDCKENKLIVLCDKENKKIVKYGCIYYCCIENEMIKIIRFIDYDVFNNWFVRNSKITKQKQIYNEEKNEWIDNKQTTWKILQFCYNKFKINNVEMVCNYYIGDDVCSSSTYHNLYFNKSHYYKNDIVYSNNMFDDMHIKFNELFITHTMLNGKIMSYSYHSFDQNRGIPTSFSIGSTFVIHLNDKFSDFELKLRNVLKNYQDKYEYR
jgi:hypothetical protein